MSEKMSGLVSFQEISELELNRSLVNILVPTCRTNQIFLSVILNFEGQKISFTNKTFSSSFCVQPWQNCGSLSKCIEKDQNR